MSQPFSSVQEDADFDKDSLEKQPSQNRDIDKDSLDKETDGHFDEDSLNEKQENDSLNKSVEVESLNKSSGRKDHVWTDTIVDKISRNTLKKDEEFPPEALEIQCNENYCYDKLDRFFSAFDFYEPSRNILRDTTKNSGKKLGVSKLKIPLQSITISKSDRKKCSYLEQYKKKCSKKLKKVMKDTELKDSKAGTNTSPASDLCSISSKPSAISIRSDGKEDAGGMISLDQSEEQLFYDAIQKYELSRSRISNVNPSDSFLDSKSSLYFKPGSREEIKEPIFASDTSYDFRKLKSIIEEKIEQSKKSEDSIEMIYVKSEKHSRASIGVQNMPNLTQRALSNQKVTTITPQPTNPIASKRSLPIHQQRSISVQKQRSMPNQQQKSMPNQQQRSMTNQQQRSMPNQQQKSTPNQQQRSMSNHKSTLKTVPGQKPIPLKRTIISNLKIQSDKNAQKSPSKRTSTEKVPKIHKSESGVHKKEWTNSTLIIRSPKRSVKLPLQKKVKSQIQMQVKNSKTKRDGEIQEKIVEPKCAEVISSASTEYKDQVSELANKKKAGNTQSEIGLRALPNQEHIQSERQRPATTNTTSPYYGTRNQFHNHKAVQRKKYLDIYQAKQNIRRIPVPIINPSVAKLPAKKKAVETPEAVKKNIQEKEEVNKERNIKTPNSRAESAKGSERNKAKPLKRYFLKKIAPKNEEDETLAEVDEDQEDLQLKLLEEKKQQLEKKLKTMNSKSRSANFVL